MAESKLNASSISSKPLLGPRKNHYCVLYNEGSDGSDDQKLALNVFKALMKQLAELGYDKVHKDIPGSNIFHNLQNMVDESEKIIVLLTPEFIDDEWHKYEQHCTIKQLLDRNEAYKRFIPIAINMSKCNIPYNLGLSVSKFIYLDYSNDESKADCWEKVTMALESTEIHYKQTREILTPSAPQMTQEILLQPVSPEEALENSDLQVDGPSSRSVTCNANTPQKSGYTELPQGPGEVQKGNSKATTNLKEDGVPSKPFTFPHSASANGVPKSLVYRMILWLWEQFGYMNSG